jgi:hypothetical protein
MVLAVVSVVAMVGLTRRDRRLAPAPVDPPGGHPMRWKGWRIAKVPESSETLAAALCPSATGRGSRDRGRGAVEGVGGAHYVFVQ